MSRATRLPNHSRILNYKAQRANGNRRTLFIKLTPRQMRRVLKHVNKNIGHDSNP